MTLAKYVRRDGESTPLARAGFSDIFDRFFEDFWAPSRALGTALGDGWLPAVDVEETDEAYQIRAEMPGMGKEDVKISLVDNVLTVSGEKRSEVRDDKKRYHRVERSYGAFQRSFSLPARIKADKVAAFFKDGVLQITVPKSEEAKPKEIAIKVD